MCPRFCGYRTADMK